MPRRQHVVHLTTDQRAECQQLIRAGRVSARVLARARVLLKADRGVRARRWTDVAIAEALEVSSRTVARVRAACATEGFTVALWGHPTRRVYDTKLDVAGQARLIALVTGPAPAGYGQWSLRLLGDALVELGIVEAIAPNTVRSTLKKTLRCSPTSAPGVCPPQAPPS